MKKAKGVSAAAWFYGPAGFGSSSVNLSVVKCDCLECWAKVDPRAGQCEPCANGDHSHHAETGR